MILDMFTRWIDSYPMSSHNTDTTAAAFTHFLGPRNKPKLIYSDGSKELAGACKALQLPHDVSTPQRPQTNGTAERAVRTVLEGTRAVLLASGLPHRWWADATRCFCFLRNLTLKDQHGLTLYQMRHNKNFKGKLIPFGALVSYKPASSREVSALSKFDTRMVQGIFMGYYLHHGCHWSGDYMVIDVSAYRGRLLGSNVPMHRVKEVHISGSPVFPIKDGTIESLPEETAEAAQPVGTAPSTSDALRPNVFDHQRDLPTGTSTQGDPIRGDV